ncbi:MAG: 4Fe-4S binding protein [Candidatus Omnitrophica bacterium]|nr:4Fe-4S binding protein [Candidatus Omnitrophota bacterium]
MALYGWELLRGLGITLTHFVRSYVRGTGRPPHPSPSSRPSPLRGEGDRVRGEGVRQPVSQDGLFTVEYPDERLAVPERFRVIPFLVYNGKGGEPLTEAANRCTACGICAKVCPPQCIWIVQAKDAATGKPKPKPSEFSIDVDVCMNCGLCAEFCPFDAIKMGHDFELSGPERQSSHIFDMPRLAVPTERYAQTHPIAWAEEEAKRAAAAAKKAVAAQAPHPNPLPGGEREKGEGGEL